MGISEYVHALLDIFYPRSCLHCKRNLNDSRELYLCDDCKRQTSYIDTFHCMRCGASIAPYGASISKESCAACKGRRLYFDSMTAIASYDGAMKTLIHKFKYARQKYLFRMLNDIIVTHNKLKDIVPDIDVVVPVPLYWLKKMRRGFNQSELLSLGINRYFSKPLSANNLCRIKNTESQTRLPKSQRQKNIHNAFFVKYPGLFQEKKILLVDDVMTTGVTASECSKKLKESGARHVHLLVLANAKYNS